MIEAYKAGRSELGAWTDPADAEQYVDSLQDAKKTQMFDGTSPEYLGNRHDPTTGRTYAQYRIDPTKKSAVYSNVNSASENASPGLSDALRSDFTENRGQILDEPTDLQLQRIREQLLKSQERELVLAKIMGGLILRAGVAGMDIMGSWTEESVNQLTRVFPELTPEE